MIPRIVYKEVKEIGSRRYMVQDLLATLVCPRQEDRFIVDEYEIMFKGIVVQVSGGELLLVKPGTKVVFDRGTVRYCRWHDGPLDSGDNPLRRRYCMNKAYGGLGYCKLHDDSVRAIYDRCVSLSGKTSLEYCRRFDNIVKGIEYVVYILVQPNGKVKVGVTRRFRWLDRIAEQQHLVATTLIVTDKLYEARRLEITLSKYRMLSDKGARAFIGHRSLGISQAILLLRSVIDGLSKDLDIEHNAHLFRIKQPAYRVEGAYAYGDQAEIIDYWGGYIYLKVLSKIQVLKTTHILHKSTLNILG